MAEPTHLVFLSYSHADEQWKDQLVRHLNVLAREHGFSVWHDRRIAAGQDWDEEINQALRASRVGVLLISADFLTSEFIREKEVARLLARHQRGELELVPILVRTCPWDEVGWLRRLQMRPNGGRALEKIAAPEVNGELTSIAREIASLVRAVRPPRPKKERPAAAWHPGEPLWWRSWRRRWTFAALGGGVMALASALALWLLQAPPAAAVAITQPPTSGRAVCELEGQIVFCQIGGTASGLPSDSRMLLWVRPHSDGAGWYLQRRPAGVNETTAEIGASGLWHGSVQLGDPIWPAREGDVFDVAVTVADESVAQDLLRRSAVIVERQPIGSPSARSMQVAVRLAR